MPQEKQSLRTMTGELFQPIRLYYRIHRKGGVGVAFRKLGCMDFDRDGDRWAWLYDDEARKIEFENPWSSIPPERRPIVLGSFYTRENDEMYLDVGSIERSLAAVVFFSRHIKRTVAEVAYVAIYNRLPASEVEHPGTCFDELFASVDTNSIERDTERRVSRLAEMAETGRIDDVLNDRSFDLVEAFPVRYHEEGIEGLRLALTMRQAVAIKHWEGNTDYRMADVLLQQAMGVSPASFGRI